jgi:MFS superfamily sulfate permease-like transporter
MVLTEATGVLCVLVGGYALARPLSVRSYPSANQWESDPEQAKQEQRAYAAMAAFSAILGGIALIVLGFLGFGP